MKTTHIKLGLTLAILIAGVTASQARYTTAGSASAQDMLAFRNGGTWWGSLHVHPIGWEPLSSADRTAIANGRGAFSWETDEVDGPSFRAGMWNTVKNAKTDGTWSMVHGFCTIREISASIPTSTLTVTYANAYAGRKTTGWTPWQQRPGFQWGSYNNLNQGLNIDAPAVCWNNVGNPWLNKNNAEMRSLMKGMMNACTKPVRSIVLNTNDAVGEQEGDTHGAAISMVNYGIAVTDWVVENFSGSPCAPARLGNAANALNGL
jgi:hypothetical protein